MDVSQFDKLLRRIDYGDNSAIEEIYDEYCNKIKLVAKHFCGTWDYADDIVNEVLIKIWNRSEKYVNIQNPDAWIYGLSKNTAITFYNKYIKPHGTILSIEQGQANVIKIYDTYDIEFYDLLQNFDSTTQEIVIMKALYKFTLKEISDELKLPPGTTAWKYREALLKIKIQIIEENSS